MAIAGKADSLTPELLDLMEHEKIIEQGLGTFIDVGNALLSIKDGKKYRAAGHKTFEDYCLKRWDMTPQQGHRVMAAAQTVTLLEPMGSIPEPQSERQVRPLASLRKEPEKAAEAWSLAVEEANGEQPTAKQVERAVQEVKTGKPIQKPDLGEGVSHPARFSDALLPVFADLLQSGDRVLDPFAGTGKVHALRSLLPVHTTGIELEPEWANLHPDTQVGNALELPFDDGEFDAIVTSPTYGNRLADHHNAADPELRRSYTHDLGHPLDELNSGDLHWGDEYRKFHEAAWLEARRVLKADGRFILNIKDHIRGGQWQDVAGWHIAELCGLGFHVVSVRPVVTGHLRQGENAHLRVAAELVIAFDK